MAPQRSLEGRVALITGASRGIGAAIAKRFASEGADVIIAARTLESLKEVDDEIRSTRKGLSATILPLDIKNRDEVSQIGPAVLERYGRLDIFVGNAAILGELTPLSQTEAECWDEVLDVNLTAQWLLIKSLETALLCSPA
ncbi:MAG: SDR family NAD(P)-dependent oxidoreductase, partial [Rhodospirillaceae bacterium]